MKLRCLIAIPVLLLTIAGCKVEADLWVDKSGSGHGTVLVSGFSDDESAT